MFRYTYSVAKDRPIPRQRIEDKPTIRILRAVNVCFARIYHRLDVVSPPHLPKEGPGILVCNHISGLDPVLIQSVCPRVIVWMMAQEYYEQIALKWFFKRLQAIPVQRSGRDLAATRQAMRALESGRILGVFPEGKIEENGELLPFQTGVAMMALRLGVGVYPSCLDGTQRRKSMIQSYLQPQRARLAFGERIELRQITEDRGNLESATNVIQVAVESLRQRLCQT